MKNFVQISEIVTRTAPSGGIDAGEGRLLGSEFHIAQTSADEGEAYSALTVGIVTLPVADGQAFEGGVGAPVYWDDGECYASSGGTRSQIGTVDAIDLGDVDVRLAGTVIPPTQVDVDVDADDVSFDPGDTGMNSTNAGAAIREVVHFVMGNAGTDGKVFPVVFKTTEATEVEFEFPDFNAEVLKIEQYIKTPKSTDGKVEIRTGTGQTGDKVGEMAAGVTGNNMIVPLDNDGDLLRVTAKTKWYITKSDAVIGGVLLVTVRKVD